MFQGISTKICEVMRAVQLYIRLGRSRASYRDRMLMKGTWSCCASGTVTMVAINIAYTYA